MKKLRLRKIKGPHSEWEEQSPAGDGASTPPAGVTEMFPSSKPPALLVSGSLGCLELSVGSSVTHFT